MWQLYYRLDSIKKTESFETKEELDARCLELSEDFSKCVCLYIEVINPEGTFVQRVTRDG